MVKSDPFRASGLATGSNTALHARVRELVGFLAAPQHARLTEEQRALMLGIARRLIYNIAEQLDDGIDPHRLWSVWSVDGIPAADALALPCFVRAEEYRWRTNAASRMVDDSALVGADDDAPDDDTAPPPPDASDESAAAIDRAYLALRIADGRRFDPLGYPCLPICDIATELYRTLALDIAAFWLAASGNDRDLARRLGERVKSLIADHPQQTGIDAAAHAYCAALRAAGTANQALLAIFHRQQWWAAVALAAGLNGMRFDEAALALLSGQSSEIQHLFAPMTLDAVELSPLVAALESLPHRSVADARPSVARAGDDDLGDLLQSRAAALATKSPGDAP